MKSLNRDIKELHNMMCSMILIIEKDLQNIIDYANCYIKDKKYINYDEIDSDELNSLLNILLDLRSEKFEIIRISKLSTKIDKMIEKTKKIIAKN